MVIDLARSAWFGTRLIVTRDSIISQARNLSNLRCGLDRARGRVRRASGFVQISISLTDPVLQSWSIYGQAAERCTSRTTSNIGRDSHFEDGDIREFDAVFFDLGCGARWTEVPLLAHDLSQCAF